LIREDHNDSQVSENDCVKAFRLLKHMKIIP